MIDPLSKEKFPDNFLNDISESNRQIIENERENIVLSNLNSPAFSIFLIAETEDIGSGVETKINWEEDEIKKDTHSGVNIDDSEYIVPVTGYYQVGLEFTIEALVGHPNRTVDWTIRLYNNDATNASQTWILTVSADTQKEAIYPNFNVDLEAESNIYATLEHNDTGNIDIAGIQFGLYLHKLIL